jgi:hypothetical protein
MKTPGYLRQKIHQLDAIIYRSVVLKFRDSLRKLAARPTVILILEMIKSDGNVNYSLKERPIFSRPLLPYFLYNIVAFEKVAAVEQHPFRIFLVEKV